MAKVNMKDTEYYKSGQHKQNVALARTKSALAINKLKQIRINEYIKTPTLCAQCGTPLPYSRKRNKFCSKSCGATFNNQKRAESGWTHTPDARDRISTRITSHLNSLTEKQKQDIQTKRDSHKNPDVIIVCSVCSATRSVPYHKRATKTCGNKDCVVQASVGCRTYINGTRRPVWFFNPFENKAVLLESSWEVEIAEYLIARNVEWVRPPFIKWIDYNNVTRRYYPDFYLPNHDLYLDPKNEHCMIKDRVKMETVARTVNIVYGSLATIKNCIDALL